MKIAIDCRMLDQSGIGSFTRGILANLPAEHRYVLLGDPARLDEFEGPGREILPCAVKPYSSRELAWRETKGIDAFLIPSISLLAWRSGRKRFIVVHDVLFLDHPEFCDGWKDRLAKAAYLRFSLFFSRAAFTVSRFSASRIRKRLGGGRPIIVAPNGLVDEAGIARRERPPKAPGSLVFVGNLKRSKNLAVILDALGIAREKGAGIALTVIGASAGLRTGDAETVARLSDGTFGGMVEFPGRLGRAEMLDAISRAQYLIQPSLYEGFSITPLEALACGTQPIVSDIPAHREIYAGAPVKFFDPRSPAELSRLMLEKPDAIGENAATDLISERGYSYRIAAKIVFGAMAGVSRRRSAG